MGRPSGLTRRKGSANWYFRKRCPKRLLGAHGRAEIWISLETPVYAEALERLDEARAEANRKFREWAETPPPSGIYPRTSRLARPDAADLPILTADRAEPLAKAFFARALREMDAKPLIARTMEPDEAQRLRGELRDQYLEALGADGGHSDPIEGAEVAVLHWAGLRADPQSQASQLLREYLRRAMAQLAAIRLARFDGDHGDDITDRMFVDHRNTVPLSTLEPMKGGGRARLDTDIVDAWATEREVDPKGIDKHRAVARWFYERVGVVSVDRITVAEVRAFKDKLIAEGTSAANTNAKLSCLRTLLQYAVQNGHLADNPARGINVIDKDAPRRRRREFDLAALNSIFSSPIYDRDERPTSGRGEAAYWIPLIALYTGARLEEIAQLRPIDVRQERYIDGEDREQLAWMLHVTEEGDGTIKNANSERRVPVHSELQRLGFVQFAQAALVAGEKFLFPGLRPNKYARRGAKWGEWWSRYRRDVCGIVDPRMVFHSFRHTFKYYARHAGMVEGVQRQIMGHSPGDTADQYGPSRYSLHQLVEGMNLYRVPGLRLPAPPPKYRSRDAVSPMQPVAQAGYTSAGDPPRVAAV